MTFQGVFELHTKKRKKTDFRDTEFFMSHYQKDAATDKGYVVLPPSSSLFLSFANFNRFRYSLKDGASFTEQASHATFDLMGDEGGLTGRQRHDKQLSWDKKKKKFVKGMGEGADNVKLVKTESGARLPASFRSGRFDEWKMKNKTSLPRVGEAESERRGGGGGGGFGIGKGGKKYRYNTTTEAKPLDPKSLSYEKKMRVMKKKAQDQEGGGDDGGDSGGGRGRNSNRPGSSPSGKGKAGQGKKFGGANIGRVKSELKSAEQIRKSRTVEARRKAQNARPSKKGKR